MDPIGASLGAISLVSQLFDGCVTAYSYFCVAAQMDVDSARLLTRVKLEEARLLIWGREWGVTEGKLEMRLEAHSLMYSGVGWAEGGPSGAGGGLCDVAVGILKQLHKTITDVKQLENRYGLRQQQGAVGTDGPEDGREREKAKETEANFGEGRTLGTGEKESEKDKKGKGWKRGKPKTAKMSLRKEFAIRARWAIAVSYSETPPCM